MTHTYLSTTCSPAAILSCNFERLSCVLQPLPWTITTSLTFSKLLEWCVLYYLSRYTYALSREKRLSYSPIVISKRFSFYSFPEYEFLISEIQFLISTITFLISTIFIFTSEINVCHSKPIVDIKNWFLTSWNSHFTYQKYNYY